MCNIAGPEDALNCYTRMEGPEMWQIDLVTVLVTADFIMFAVILALVRKLWAGLRVQLAAVVENPEAMTAIGRGIAQGMRQSGLGKEGKDKQVTRGQERTLMTTVLKDWMGANAPMVRMLMDSFPETWRLVQQQPELAFVMMSKFGPMLEGHANQAIEKLSQGVEKAVR